MVFLVIMLFIYLFCIFFEAIEPRSLYFSENLTKYNNYIDKYEYNPKMASY